jgi:RNA polymerase sigma-70 factor, ECF subfamily
VSGDRDVIAAAEAAGIDVQLMNRLAAGDRDAVSELYDRHAARVFSLAHRILGNGTDAEDIVQDVFSQAWRTAPNYQAARGPVAAWLLVMTRTRAIDRIRARRGLTQPLDASGDLPDGTRPASDDLIAREEASQVRNAVLQLPADQRRALELAYFEGLSQSEIAAQLQTPLGTVKTRIRTALATLRRSVQR